MNSENMSSYNENKPNNFNNTVLNIKSEAFKFKNKEKNKSMINKIRKIEIENII